MEPINSNYWRRKRNEEISMAERFEELAKKAKKDGYLKTAMTNARIARMSRRAARRYETYL